MKCQKCGTLLPSDAKFCDTCGAAQFELLQCENCNAEVNEQWQFCPFCGYDLKHHKNTKELSLLEVHESKIKEIVAQYLPKIYNECNIENILGSSLAQAIALSSMHPWSIIVNILKKKLVNDSNLEKQEKLQYCYTFNEIQNRPELFYIIETYIVSDIRRSDIYGFIAFFDFKPNDTNYHDDQFSCNGLVFTNDAVHIKTDVNNKTVIPYLEISEKLHTGISSKFYHADQLAYCLEEIRAVLRD